MISNNKILTVSYGTFSCTLEGFDDSFGTMKAIAEYFRDLASDDRYFGAEPPQPDAEMLQRIAEREISRRVEARHHEGKIYLSAAESDDDAVTDTAPAVDDAALAAAARAKADHAEAERAEKAAAEALAEQQRVQAEADAKAERDAIAAAQAQAAADKAAAEAKAEAEAARALEAAKAAKVEADIKAENAASDDDDADLGLSALIAHAAASDAPRNPRDLAAELPQAEAFFAGEAGNDDIEDEAELVVADDAPADSITAKLDRIRAVVSQAGNASDDDDDYSEDEHAEKYAAQPADVVESAADDSVAADALADIEAALAADDIAEAPVEPVGEDQDDDDIASILASLTDDDDADDGDAMPDANLFDDSQDAKTEDTKIEAEVVAAPAPNDVPRRVARVIKVKRADLEAAIAQGDLEEIDDDEDSDAASSLSDDDEAELARELAEVGAEIKPKTDVADMSAHALSGIDALPSIDENTGDDVSRLMAQADEHMDDAEGAQRRDAFAHLRAAVAAKKADIGLGETDPEKEEGAYRDDLATVVKPRRPSADGERSVRPDPTPRPAPLKLVAEQRVDATTIATGPVRPRRVAAVQDAVQSVDDAGSFAEFADDMGATNLSDLLEAAAAYMSFVEGRKQFSRPQLMTKVRQVEKEDFSREDGLRSFGKLLRAGKIEKLKGGRFAVTRDIGFRPDARAAG